MYHYQIFFFTLKSQNPVSSMYSATIVYTSGSKPDGQYPLKSPQDKSEEFAKR